MLTKSDVKETRLRLHHPDHGLLSRADRPRTQTTGALALGAAAWGALALGAIAVGALAIGRLRVGRAAADRVKIRQLSVDRLEVGELTVRHSTGLGPSALAATPAQPSPSMFDNPSVPPGTA
ncbi:hypothetical protein [Caulobacter sp. 17J80-11]|uniref:hypothetical protein n=1 Tax=Caulobacter sp. 17J80-11 TaxID=2763502 RepID=UPI0016539896|nr:hypothetical protein [Caulobacter sp. 17J80-11]MBC6981487.1 hypothetical protein [Caulobacter sp. 17J80-11]